MSVSEKIKSLRSERGWSQEQMAEKLGVSRQAITKWETEAGMPDIDNLAAIARLFGVTTDSLLFDEVRPSGEAGAERYQSVTSVDIATEKHYDVKVGCARSVTLRGSEGEKLIVRLEADAIADLERAFKVALDTEGRNFDIEVTSTGVVADVLARQQLDVVIELPNAYSEDVEVELYVDELRIEGVQLDIEVGGKMGRVWVTDARGRIELDVPVDMEIWADGMSGEIDINQVGATSVLHVANGLPFTAASRGHLGKRRILFTRNGEPCEAPDVSEAPLAIELSGARCELTIDSMA